MRRRKIIIEKKHGSMFTTGTGDSRLKTPYIDYLLLYQQYIQLYDYQSFTDYCIDKFVNDDKSYRVDIIIHSQLDAPIQDNGQPLFGLAQLTDWKVGQIDLYNHTVAVFLHELTHIILFLLGEFDSMHGPLFGKFFDRIIKLWHSLKHEYEINRENADITLIDHEKNKEELLTSKNYFYFDDKLLKYDETKENIRGKFIIIVNDNGKTKQYLKTTKLDITENRKDAHVFKTLRSVRKYSISVINLFPWKKIQILEIEKG